MLAELTAAGGTWLGAVSRAPDGTDLVVTSPGLAARLAAARRRRPPGHRGDRGAGAGLAAAHPAPARRALAGRHRHQRQDDDGHHARVDPPGRRPPRGRRRQRRPALVDVVTARDDDGTPAFDVLAVELSSFQLHWSLTLARGRRRAQRRRRPHRLARLASTPTATRRPGSWSGAGGRGRRRRPGRRRARAAPPAPGHRHPRRAGAGPARRRGGRAGGPRVQRRPGRAGAARRLADLQVRGPHNVVNALAAAALALAAGMPRRRGRPGPGGVRRRRAPQRPAALGRRGGLRRRQQGHQPARGRGVPGRVPARWSGSPAACSRVPTSIRWSPRSPGGWPASSCSAATGP